MSSDQATPAKAPYHHGDLRRSLCEEALQVIRSDGIAALSLRRLAERVGVSQTALYHYFRNKEDLLLVVGEAAIEDFNQYLFAALDASTGDRLEAFVVAYLRYARDNPEVYELIFGRASWKDASPHAFHQTARASIRRYSTLIQGLQARGVIAGEINVLRLLQVGWATLHGLSRMYNDGLAFTAEAIEDIGLHAARLLRGTLTGQPGADAR